MPIDWELQASAMQRSEGNELETIAFLSSLLTEAETDAERAALILGEASCYCSLGKLEKTFELLESAKKLAQGDRAVLSQIVFSEATTHAINGEAELACSQYLSIRSEYTDLLREDEEFGVELDSRLACALVEVGRDDESLPLLRKVIDHPHAEKQWIQLYLAIALMNTGKTAEARLHFFAAAKGQNAKWSKSALEHLSAMDATQ